MPTNTNVPANVPSNNAKAKPMSKAEQQRIALDKALASAAKKVEATTYDKAMASYVIGHDEQASRKRVMAMFLNNEFAEEMAEFRCHWSEIYDSKNAKNADNMKALWHRIDEKRQAMKQFCIDNRKSLSNTDKPWSDAKLEAKALFYGKGKGRRNSDKTFQDNVKETFLRLYKAHMKEKFPTDADLQLGDIIGRTLDSHFRVDLSEF